MIIKKPESCKRDAVEELNKCANDLSNAHVGHVRFHYIMWMGLLFIIFSFVSVLDFGMRRELSTVARSKKRTDEKVPCLRRSAKKSHIHSKCMYYSECLKDNEKLAVELKIPMLWASAGVLKRRNFFYHRNNINISKTFYYCQKVDAANAVQENLLPGAPGNPCTCHVK